MSYFNILINKISPRFLLKILRNFKLFFLNLTTTGKVDKFHLVDGVKIKLPFDHNLDLFQKLFISYDKLICVIAKHIPIDSTVIDVGANVGDSAVPFLKRKIHTICVEPSTYFLEYLKLNVNNNGFEQDCEIVNSLVSSNIGNNVLNVYNGTATVGINVENVDFKEDVISSLSLTNLCSKFSNISFIKIDTDGFDFDVIMSGAEFLKSNSPLLLFENLVHYDNLANFENAHILLEECGYNYIYVFDNFGQFMFFTNNWNSIKDFNSYIVNNSFSKISYLDVFCFKEDKIQIGDQIIDSYKRECIKY